MAIVIYFLHRDLPISSTFILILYPRTGIAGTLAVLGYGAYAYRFRGAMSTSRYLMRLRVLSQGAIVCSMIIGAALTSWTSNKKK